MEAPIAPSPALRKSILRTFTRKYNLTLQSAALGYIVTVLSQHGLLDRSEDWEESCEALAKGFIESEGPGNSDGGEFFQRKNGAFGGSHPHTSCARVQLRARWLLGPPWNESMPSSW